LAILITFFLFSLSGYWNGTSQLLRCLQGKKPAAV